MSTLAAMVALLLVLVGLMVVFGSATQCIAARRSHLRDNAPKRTHRFTASGTPLVTTTANSGKWIQASSCETSNPEGTLSRTIPQTGSRFTASSHSSNDAPLSRNHQEL